MITFKQFLGEGHMRDLTTELDLPAEFWGTMHDTALDWFNQNKTEGVYRLLKDKEYSLGSKLLFWKEHIKNVPNFSEELGTVQEFQAALKTPITLWRGGQGVYDPEYILKRKWVSFTAKRERANTFSEYEGTFGMKFLPKSRGRHWIIELVVPLDKILLYLRGGGDEEVIVSVKDAKNVKVIKQS